MTELEIDNIHLNHKVHNSVMSDSGNQSTLDILKNALKASKFSNHMGVIPVYCQDGKSELELKITENMTQHMNIVHGAVLGFVADSACCWAAISEFGNVVTAEYKINFITPAIGQKLIGKGQIIGSSSRSAITRADIYVVNNGREKIVATAIATIAAV